MQVSGGSRPRGGFGRLWAAGAISNLGDGMLLAAIPLLVSTLTLDPPARGLCDGRGTVAVALAGAALWRGRVPGPGLTSLARVDNY